MSFGKSGIVAAVLLVFFLFTAQNLEAGEVRVAVASNFLLPLKKMSGEFENLTGGKVTIISGSTGKLYAQIKQGAPFDVLLSADSARPELLEKEGLGISGSRFTYAVGRLALWSPDSKIFSIKDLQVLEQSNFRYLAIANPKTAPYGKAAKQVLTKKGFWGKLQSRLVRGENISQTFQFVMTRNAEIGLVALSQLKGKKTPISGSSWVIPSDWHDPIRQQVVLLKSAKQNHVARKFLDFLKSERAQKIIKNYGYSVEN